MKRRFIDTRVNAVLLRASLFIIGTLLISLNTTFASPEVPPQNANNQSGQFVTPKYKNSSIRASQGTINRKILSDQSSIQIINDPKGTIPQFTKPLATNIVTETLFYDGMESDPWPYFGSLWKRYYGDKQRYWDDVSYNYNGFGGNWSAWPAAGGSGGKIPEAGDDKYPSNTSTWMIYGPFDLRGSQQALWAFYMWREIAQGDLLFFGYSIDGQNFQGWNVTNTDPFWRLIRVDISPLINQKNLWIGWYFESDDSKSARGPYIDDIFIIRTRASSPNGSRISVPMANFSKYIPPNNPDPCNSYEPNDGLKDAKPFGASGTSLQSTACLNDNDDLYYFNVSRAGTVQITLNLSQTLYKNTSLNVYYESGQDGSESCYRAPPISGRTGSPETIVATCNVNPGKHYLWLSDLKTTTSNNTYRVQVIYP